MRHAAIASLVQLSYLFGQKIRLVNNRSMNLQEVKRALPESSDSTASRFFGK
jgi:hypothetical protein